MVEKMQVSRRMEKRLCLEVCVNRSGAENACRNKNFLNNGCVVECEVEGRFKCTETPSVSASLRN